MVVGHPVGGDAGEAAHAAGTADCLRAVAELDAMPTDQIATFTRVHRHPVVVGVSGKVPYGRAASARWTMQAQSRAWVGVPVGWPSGSKVSV